MNKIDWDNYNQVLKKVKKDSWNLQFASERLKDNDVIVIEAVKNKGYALKFASDRLKDNEIFMLEAVKNKGWCLEHASDRIKSNKSFILKLLMLFKNDEDTIYYIKKFINKDLKKESNL